MPYIKIPLHGRLGNGKYTLVDGDYDGEYFGQFRWWVNKFGYVVRKDNEYSFSAKTGHTRFIKSNFVYLHDEVCRKARGKWVDHINRDKLDNRSCNLRPVTPSENGLNHGRRLKTPEEKAKTRRKWVVAHKEQKKEYDRLRRLMFKVLQ